MAIQGSPKGFTLLEMLIILTIITILSAIATISISEYTRRSGLKNAAQTIETDLITARAAARARQQRVLVDFAAATYNAYVDNNSDAVFNVGVDDLVLTNVYSVNVNVAGVAPFVLPGGNITFTPTGNTTAQTAMTLNWGTDAARVFRITIRQTGIILVERSETGVGGPWTRAW